MFLPLAVALLPQAPQSAWQQPYVVPQPARLAVTPRLDGRQFPEEWEPLDELERAYLQWEPDRLFWAGEAADGEDVVLCLDLDANGWLAGDDNYEIRVTMRGGEAVTGVRRLDARSSGGAKWVDGGIAPDSLRVAAGKADGGWFVEGSLVPDARYAPSPGRRLAARIDLVSTGQDTGEPYMPRQMGQMTLVVDQGKGLPAGFSWKPTFLIRSVPTGDAVGVKYVFHGQPSHGIKSIETRCEGFARGFANSGSKAFPKFDAKGRSFYEYESKVLEGADFGYRAVRTTLVREGGEETVLRSSFRIADLVDLEVRLPSSLSSERGAQVVRGSVEVRSNGTGRIDGKVDLLLPKQWTAMKGRAEQFLIYHGRGRARVGLEFVVPRGSKGTHPVTVQATMGTRVITKTVYLPVE